MTESKTGFKTGLKTGSKTGLKTGSKTGPGMPQTGPGMPQTGPEIDISESHILDILVLRALGLHQII